MQQICAHCSAPFEITDDDLAFYDKVSPIFNGKKELIPPPTQCPNCRQQRRFVWRNERSLYRRSCSVCQKNIVAMYTPETPFPVFCPEDFWSDAHDPRNFGLAIDPHVSFFDQLKELIARTPRLSLSSSSNENCEFTNYTNASKNCYLVFGCYKSEECYHCWRAHDCMGCVDCTQLYNSQYCYDCIDCDRGYNLLHCINCFNCKDSSFLSQCTGCTNCFGCINLVHKEHYIFNEAYSAEEYAKEVSRLMHAPSEVQLRLQSLREIQPHRARTLINCEQCIGDYLIDCQNCTDVFTAKNCQDCTRVYLSEDAKDCWDCDIVGWPGELCYEGISTCANAVHNLFCNTSWGSTDIMYCDSCFDIRDCFGCVGLKKERYCILNKQYTKEEYEVLVPKIIESMREVGQYGEFFPVVISPFAYNESIVQEYFPLTKKEVIDKNWKWNEYETPLPIVEKVIAAPALPETIQDVPDDILQWAIECERTKRPFRITKQELDFYRRHEISVPRIHPDERHRIRIAQRNPRTLWNRSCVNCQKPIQTTYSPDRPEIIYCEECYLKEVY